MKAKDLIRELETYPDDWEVVIEVNGKQAAVSDVDMQGWKGDMALVIHDYPVTNG